MTSDPSERFDGTILLLAPHMDDEVLACGGLLARLPMKERIHIVYATDGMMSPAPVIPWKDAISPDLGEIRMRESEEAVGLLGVPGENLRFLALPEARLQESLPELRRHLLECLDLLDPDHLLMPFRFDRHPDHLAVNRIVTEAVGDGRCRATVTEYFVYYRWRLLPRKDVRRYIRPENLFDVDIREVASTKRAALDRFKTQTTIFYPWQTRPILTPTLLDEECVGPEIFLRFDPRAPARRVFSGWVPWIRIAHRLEPRLQKWKYLAKSTLTRGIGGISRDPD
jgi:LmbE family N-acetylglucosaminyl deacetylase